MTKVETIGVVVGGRAAGLNSVIRGAAPVAISASSIRTAGTTFEGGA